MISQPMILPSIFDDTIVYKVIYIQPIKWSLFFNFQSLAIKVEHFINFQLQNNY